MYFYLFFLNKYRLNRTGWMPLIRRDFFQSLTCFVFLYALKKTIVKFSRMRFCRRCCRSADSVLAKWRIVIRTARRRNALEYRDMIFFFFVISPSPTYCRIFHGWSKKKKKRKEKPNLLCHDWLCIRLKKACSSDVSLNKQVKTTEGPLRLGLQREAFLC